jgi:hypothetical protein
MIAATTSLTLQRGEREGEEQDRRIEAHGDPDEDPDPLAPGVVDGEETSEGDERSVDDHGEDGDCLEDGLPARSSEL